MIGSPRDLAHPPPAAPVVVVKHISPRVFVGVPRTADPWEVQPCAVRVGDVQIGFTTVPLAVRQGDRRSRIDLTADGLRELAEHLHDCADLIDPPKET